MSNDPGPLEELADNLTGAAAGHYANRAGESTSLSETQGPTGRAADPLGRRQEQEDEEEDRPAVDRPEDADGAPEL